MKKRILCFVTAAALTLLPWPAPAELCEDGHADPSAYYTVGAIDPTETEPGYSGDFYCPVCHTLMVHGWRIDPLPPSGGNGKTGQPAIQTPGSGTQEAPSGGAGDKDDPDGQEKAKEQDKQKEPEKEPEQDKEPGQDKEPEQDKPKEPEAPSVQESPARQETPDDTSDPPARPEEPVVIPVNPSTSANDTQEPEVPVLPPVPSEPEEDPNPIPELLPVEPEPDPVLPDPADPADLPSSITGQRPPEREHFSENYPFRRVRMNPDPGIRAPAAGILIWPKETTPMQKMLKGD